MSAAPSRRQPPEVRRDQVLDAATVVLLERGLQAATIAEIADTAGLGKGTVYLSFESKDALLAGLRQRYVEQMESDVRALVGRARSDGQRLAALVGGLIEAGSRDPALHHVLFHEAGVSEADAFAPIRALTNEVLGEDVDELTVEFVLGGIHAAVVVAAHRPNEHRQQIVRTTTALVLGALNR